MIHSHTFLDLPNVFEGRPAPNCMLQVLPTTPPFFVSPGLLLPVGEGKVLEERFVQLQSSVALWCAGKYVRESGKGWWY